MPIDFTKLSDPVYQAARKAEREEESRRYEAKQQEIKILLNQCLDAVETMPERERSFIRSCQRRISTYLPLSEAQEKWLRDIAAKLE